VYLTRDDRGWHVRARRGGPDGVEVVHHFTDEPDAHAMLLRRASASQTSGTPITVRRAGGRDAGAF
jgi:hypothetical protein